MTPEQQHYTVKPESRPWTCCRCGKAFAADDDGPWAILTDGRVFKGYTYRVESGQICRECC
jgi:hypothetical protein